MSLTNESKMIIQNGNKSKNELKDNASLKTSKKLATAWHVTAPHYVAYIMLLTVILMLPGARHLILRSALKFWSYGQLAEDVWEYVLSITGEHPFVIFILVPNIITIGLYWIFSGLFLILDITNKPTFLTKYKVQKGICQLIDRAKLTKAIKTILFNQFIVTLPFNIAGYFIMSYTGFHPLRPLPQFHVFILQILFNILLQEPAFYYAHRLLHHKYFYKRFHKQHHEWTEPIALITIYCHPVEHILSNFLPAMLGPLFTGPHPLTTWLWVASAVVGALNTHTGYHIPFVCNARFHDYHHKAFNECFGSNGFCDWIHKTDVTFRKYRDCTNKQDSTTLNKSKTDDWNEKRI